MRIGETIVAMIFCSICQGPTTQQAEARIRGQYPAVFLQCLNCGFLFVPNPTWLAEAYAEPINRSDTGYVWRNWWGRDKARNVIELALHPDGTFLDYAAGYGLFVRLMRDAGYDFRWSDIYCPNLFAQGFEAPLPLTGPYEAVTAFEVFEHLPHPVEEMQKLSALTSCLIFSTVLVPEPVPEIGDWAYYGVEHGQHISFYTRKSLEELGRPFGFHLVTNGKDLHMFSRKPVVAEVLSYSPNRLQRLWARLSGKKDRPSLLQSDHDAIVAKMTENR